MPKLRMPPRRINSRWPIGADPAGPRLRREAAAQVNGMGMQRRMRYPGDGDFEVRPSNVPLAGDFSTSTTNHEEGARKTMKCKTCGHDLVPTKASIADEIDEVARLFRVYDGACKWNHNEVFKKCRLQLLTLATQIRNLP